MITYKSQMEVNGQKCVYIPDGDISHFNFYHDILTVVSGWRMISQYESTTKKYEIWIYHNRFTCKLLWQK